LWAPAGAQGGAEGASMALGHYRKGRPLQSGGKYLRYLQYWGSSPLNPFNIVDIVVFRMAARSTELSSLGWRPSQSCNFSQYWAGSKLLACRIPCCSPPPGP